MKIKDFSEEKGLTKQAVYKAISRAGFSAKQITDRNGNITGKGFSVLRSLFPDPDPETDNQVEQGSSSGDRQQQPGTAAEIDRLKKQTEHQAAELERLQDRIRELEESCKQWEKRYFDSVEAAKQEGQQLRVLLSQEQQLRLAAERKGLFRRLFAGKKADDEA